MFKLFSIEEATRLLPFVDETLRDMQQAAQDVVTLRDQHSKLNAWSVGARNVAEEIKFLLSTLQGHKAELDRRGIQLRDIETGVVDFPSRLGAEVVCLCWEQGEDAIAYYHRLNDDTTKRRPIEAHPQVTETDAVLAQVVAQHEVPETPATPS
ncbi:MAG: DUF2203 domain-containing protein [Trueperaceae bacterium]|nr:DUF2203 domain-containing protein [Trueperaceae bacterium]